MDETSFDVLAQVVGAHISRRRVLVRTGALPLVGGLAALLGQEGQITAKPRPKKCPSQDQVCDGKCGSVTYKCKKKTKTVNCGSCTCDVCHSTCQFSTIQAAIDAAPAGATIRVCRGKYIENISIAKDLTLVGITNPNTWVVLESPGDTRVVHVAAGDVSLKTFKITGGQSDAGGGILISAGATLRTTNCMVSGNTAVISGGGIRNNGVLEMTDSIVSGNTAGFQGGGIYSYYADTDLIGSTVTGNTSATHPDGWPTGGGLYNWASFTLCTEDGVVFGNSPEDFGGGGGDGVIEDCQA